MARRVPLTEAEKQLIQNQKEQGMSLKQIAKEMDCSFETTRKWWRLRRDHQPPRARGRPTLGILSSYHAHIRTEAIFIKEAHPHWGPANVRLELQKQFALLQVPLPSDARLSALFRALCPQAVQPRTRRAYPEEAPRSVGYPHLRWQMDAKEAVRIGEKEYANILDIRDPVGALIIASQAFLTTQGNHWRKLSLAETQAVLRQAFQTWGMPVEIQTDRETVYVGSADRNFPSPFSLWLVGLGIRHVVGRSHRPTDQAQIERNHRTLADMAWRDQHFESVQQLQAALDEHRQRYNEQYPAEAADCQGQPPLSLHPWARFSGRGYHPALEQDAFDMQRVDRFLSQQVWSRQVTSTGVATFGDHRYYVGRAYRGQRISGQFILEGRSIRFQTRDGTLIKELPAVGLDKKDLIGCIPEEEQLPVDYQLPLPLVGV